MHLESGERLAKPQDHSFGQTLAKRPLSMATGAPFD
jgi:hypothetical protein